MKSPNCFRLRSAGGVVILLALFLLLLPFNSWAALGDNAASVLTDQAQMKGTLSSTDNQTYVLHEITMTSGAKVREYRHSRRRCVRSRVGRAIPPDLKLLLGPYYQQAQQAIAQQERPKPRPSKTEYRCERARGPGDSNARAWCCIRRATCAASTAWPTFHN